jgi:hypothetical protein
MTLRDPRRSEAERRRQAWGRVRRPFARSVPALLLLFAGTAGCSSFSDDTSAIATATQSVQVPLAKAFLTPPPGGPAMLALVETKYANAVAQEIALATQSVVPGQNAFHVTIYRQPKPGLKDSLSDKELGRPALRKEMNERLPGVPMKFADYYVQNRYGPFGYAVGRAKNGELCLYGWQRIVPNQSRYMIEGPRGAIAVRLRLCNVRATEPELLAAMYDFSINAYVRSYSWNPYGEAAPPSPSLGKPSAPVLPVGPLGPASVVDGQFGRDLDAEAAAAAARRGRGTGRGQGEGVRDPAYPVVPPPPAATEVD